MKKLVAIIILTHFNSFYAFYEWDLIRLLWTGSHIGPWGTKSFGRASGSQTFNLCSETGHGSALQRTLHSKLVSQGSDVTQSQKKIFLTS